MSHRFPRVLQKLSDLQVRRPWAFIVVAVLSLVPAIAAASGLGFRSDFAELLPDSKDSVIEMRRVSKRLAGASTLTIVAQLPDGRHPEALERFVDAIVPKLHALGPEWVGAIDWGVRDTRKFFSEHELLYAPLDKLEELDREVVERHDWEVAKAQGTLLDETDAPPPLTAASIRERLGAGSAEPKADPYPDGYYLSKERDLIAVLVRTPVEGKAASAELQRKVADLVAATDPHAFDPAMTVRYTGDLITSAEEYDAIVRDLGEVGAWGVAGVLGSVLLFFLRVRTVLTMGGTLIVGLAWTFGLTRYAIGYLNSSSGFLVSIIAGNGINYGIMYMARYVEARRDQGVGVDEAIRLAHRDSWVPTLASAATAMLAYGSLMVTDFRGFKHFGVIGSYAMMICWVATYLFMPPLLVASERVWPAFRPGERAPKVRGNYGAIFAKIALGAPRTVTILGAVLGLASIALSVRYFATDPMEYDMKNVRNERKDSTAAGELSGRVDDIVGRIGQDGMAVMTDRVDQVPDLTRALNARYDAAPADLKPFEKVVSIFSVLPEAQQAKLPVVRDLRDRLLQARRRGFVADDAWKEIEPHLPKGELAPIGIADLPEQVARAFTERDGTRGRIVYIVPKDGFSVWDAKYLMRWADSFRSTTLPSGEVIKGSGRAVIFADMIRTIGEDAPKAIAVAAFGTILVILVAFRGNRHAWGVFIPWLFGLTGLVAFLELHGTKLNFLNFVALPITTGIGAEYAHNLMQRYRAEGPERLEHVVRETGGAVILCSLTTTIGYLALLLSINKGIVGFGLAAAVGEVTCVVAAVLVLPAFLAWRAQRRRPKDDAAPPAEARAA